MLPVSARFINARAALLGRPLSLRDHNFRGPIGLIASHDHVGPTCDVKARQVSSNPERKGHITSPVDLYCHVRNLTAALRERDVD